MTSSFHLLFAYLVVDCKMWATYATNSKSNFWPFFLRYLMTRMWIKWMLFKVNRGVGSTKEGLNYQVLRGTRIKTFVCLLICSPQDPEKKTENSVGYLESASQFACFASTRKNNSFSFSIKWIAGKKAGGNFSHFQLCRYHHSTVPEAWSGEEVLSKRLVVNHLNLSWLKWGRVVKNNCSLCYEPTSFVISIGVASSLFFCATEEHFLFRQHCFLFFWQLFKSQSQKFFFS